MEIRSVSRVHHPREKVFLAYRDRMPEMVPYMDDVREIVVRSRVEDGDVVKLHNEWVGKTEIPRAMAFLIKPEHLIWDDHAEWHHDGYYCDFRIATRVFTSAVRCSGRNTLIEDGQGTRIELTGDFSIDTSALPGVPSVVGRRLAPQIERFIVSLVTPNLTKVTGSLERFLDAVG